MTLHAPIPAIFSRVFTDFPRACSEVRSTRDRGRELLVALRLEVGEDIVQLRDLGRRIVIIEVRAALGERARRVRAVDRVRRVGRLGDRLLARLLGEVLELRERAYRQADDEERR